MTKIVNLKYEKYDVYIGRAGKGKDGYFGNPYTIGKDGWREEVITKYRSYFYIRIVNDKEFKNKILTLKNKTLGCFCSPLKCHGDIIKEYLDTQS